MRGMYTAGILDVLMEEKIQVDGVIGVSAGVDSLEFFRLLFFTLHVDT